MALGSFWTYVVLEALALLGVWTIYQHWKIRRLSARLVNPVSSSGSQALNVESYTDLVNKEILNCETKLARLADRQADESGLASTIQTRLAFLRAERDAAIDQDSGDEAFWTRMSELLAACLPAPVDTESVENSEDEPDSEVEALRARIQAYETRVSNLEQFKQLFFELKMKQINSKSLEEKIRTEVGKAIPEQEQAPELKDMLSSLREENHTLEEQLGHIEHELDDILRAAGPAGSGEAPASNASTGVVDDVENIRQVISQYKMHVHELNGLIMNLKLDVKDKESLEKYAEQQKSQYEELQAAMHHLEEENDFLQEQISALLKQELEKEAQIKADAEEVKGKLDARLAAYAELEGKYAEMEQSYLAVYQENRKLTEASGGD